MNIIFFETIIWQQIQEICHNKLLHEVTIGIYTNQQRATAQGYSSQIIAPRLQEYPYNHLAPIYQGNVIASDIIDPNEIYTDYINTDCIHTDCILWNSSFIFESKVFESNLIQDMPLNSCIMSSDNIWIAVKVNHLSDELISLLYHETALPLDIYKTVNLVDFRSYENVVVGVQNTIQDDMELYINTHPDLVEIQKNVFVHPKANIRDYVDFDTTLGKIIIEENTNITAFTLIQAPVFIGRECLITRAFLRPKTAIGNGCRVAGEVSLMTICDFSNKSHDGCIALSYIGSWVNLGAGTECATLKYTYTPVSFNVDGQKIPTSMIGMGTIFNDFVVTGVGTILSPATVLGIGSALHEPYQNIPTYTKPFAWNKQQWHIEKWIETVIKKKQIKNKKLNPDKILFYKELYDYIHKNIKK